MSGDVWTLSLLSIQSLRLQKNQVIRSGKVGGWAKRRGGCGAVEGEHPSPSPQCFGAQSIILRKTDVNLCMPISAKTF